MENVPQPRRAATLFIVVTVVIDALAIGIIVPVLPSLVVQLSGGDEEWGALVYGLFGTTFALMQFVFSPIIGAISDRYGRRPVILLSNFGLGLDYILMAVAPSLGWLFLGRVIAGITGASMSAAGAYIADVTPLEKRAAGFGMLGAAFGLGFILGPALGGLLGQLGGPRLPFWIAAGVTLLNATYGLFILPESLSREHRREFSWWRANPIGSLGMLRKHPELLGLAAVTWLFYLAHESLPSAFVLYAGYRYGWEKGAVGLTLAWAGICSMIIQGTLVQPVVRAWGERKALLAGLAFGIMGFAIYGTAPTGILFAMGIPVMALWGFYGAASQGLMTRRVSVSEQGQLQGSLTGLRGIAGLIGPGLFTGTFAAAIGPLKSWNLPGAPFLLASALLALGLVIAWRVTRGPAPARDTRIDSDRDPEAELVSS